MSIIDKIRKLIGQVKPSDYPASHRPNPSSKDRDLILNPINNNVLQDSFPNGNAEQLANNPYNTNEESDLARAGEESTQLTNLYVEIQDLHTNHPTPEPINVNEKTIRKRELMGIEDVRDVNPLIAQKMERLGILTLDKTLFMERYAELQLRAAELEVSISELIQNELL